MFWEKGNFPLLRRGFVNTSNLDNIDLKIFQNHGGIYTFERKFNKIPGGRYCKASEGLKEICIFELDPEGLAAGW